MNVVMKSIVFKVLKLEYIGTSGGQSSPFGSETGFETLATVLKNRFEQGIYSARTVRRSMPSPRAWQVPYR